jgi:spermidine synthase
MEHRLKAYLCLLVFFTGAGIMVVELLGTHVLAPCYGSGLYVWSSLISVTLVALAVGYWVGGRVADRHPKLTVLCGIVTCAALLLLVLPLFTVPVLRLNSGLGLKWGAFTTALMLFFLPLALLGIATPFAIKLRLHLLDETGSVSGGMFAISTVGSVTGTILTSFYLLPALGTYYSFLGVGIVLLCVSVAGLILSRKIAASALIVVVGLSLAFVSRTPGASGFDQRFRVLHSAESFYGKIDVLEDELGTRYLLVNGICQTRLPEGMVLFSYPGALLSAGVLLEMLPFYYPRGEKALFVGMGGGYLPRFFENVYGWETTSVDIDPEVVRIAREYFGFEGDAVVADGRRFIREVKERFDFILLDVYCAETIPSHLYTEGAFEAVKSRLTSSGTFAVSHIGTPYERSTIGLYKTLSAVFPYVVAYTSGGEGAQFVYLFASEKELIFNISEERKHKLHLDRLQPLLFEDEEDVPILTDETAPLALWRAETAAIWRAASNRRFRGK